MNQKLRQELLNMAEKDKWMREQLAADGSLFEGYHPKMEAVHKQNAKRLSEIIKQYNWPGKTLVGEDGTKAAWLILQHDIGEPEFLRASVPLLEQAVTDKEIPGSFLAKLVDRICFYEGRPQVYGTQFDWDETGEMNPTPIEHPENVDDKRASVGLPPLAETTQEMRKRATENNERRPKDMQAYKNSMGQWLRSVGWRN